MQQIASSGIASVPAMQSTDSHAPGLRRAVWIAALLSFAVTVVRLAGENLGWAPSLFDVRPGGGLSPLGITWLVPLFGFWFGRRLARAGSAPASTWRALSLHLLGIGLIVAVFVLVFRAVDDWRMRSVLVNAGTFACGLLALFAWPKCWRVLVCYGLLARAPVMLAQVLSVRLGWSNHFAKGPPGSDPDDALFLLTLAQCVFWPFPFTVLVGGAFATIGAVTARR
jgi:hypothetical protein